MSMRWAITSSVGHITPASFRAEYMGHNFGWPVMFLGQGRLRPDWVTAHGGPEAEIDHLQGLELLHDSTPSGWHFQGPNEEVCKRALDAFKKYGVCICSVLEYEKTYIGLSHDYRKHRRWDDLTALPLRLDL